MSVIDRDRAHKSVAACASLDGQSTWRISGAVRLPHHLRIDYRTGAFLKDRATDEKGAERMAVTTDNKNQADPLSRSPDLLATPLFWLRYHLVLVPALSLLRG
jgi:hypothetical protein